MATPGEEDPYIDEETALERDERELRGWTMALLVELELELDPNPGAIAPLPRAAAA